MFVYFMFKIKLKRQFSSSIVYVSDSIILQQVSFKKLNFNFTKYTFYEFNLLCILFQKITKYKIFEFNLIILLIFKC